ncbi:MAG TPA: DNA polymerase III subunit delta [Rickettsia endosymbiont of Proechinophthirus fluctus]|uniref:DNA polymerase III subunit delta n=1 Tax=Rickettsia endosymbiont of Proechinophthirus fluctus TaxID=1462733 RepID=UPI000789E193|nr:DNA polymerase III subunit delta [Rickettsia endosymbiont of Proechinophthirus fluctus]KYP98683.1 DNA polymerase III subunit delta [Rickettsia endosymbiont of Proechinophthirus fluctus]HJD54762.1 DNA polymerase III subunit delta [Rickettsia endosymbiont of Proechinophthirus fluctus]
MKFYFSQIGRLFELITSGKIRALLLYGSDKGYIEKICKHLVKSLNMLQTSIEYADLNISSLEILLNSSNFFGQKELIKIRSVGNSIDQNLKTILNSDYINFPVFIGEEMTSSGSIRRFFETEEYLAAVACYHDDEAKIERIILGKVEKTNKVISKEAITYLKAHLKGDHDLICSEINKLIYFVHDAREITLNDVLEVISSEITANGSDLAMYFSKKDYSNFLQELDILKKQNINEVLIIRALIRHYLNLYIVLSKVKNGERLELAIKSLSPPIFYQYINDFTKIANGLSLTECLKTLKVLQQAEVDYKLNPASFDLFQSILQSK